MYLQYKFIPSYLHNILHLILETEFFAYVFDSGK
jgi:hypothetical protein